MGKSGSNWERILKMAEEVQEQNERMRKKEEFMAQLVSVMIASVDYRWVASIVARRWGCSDTFESYEDADKWIRSRLEEGEKE